MLGIIELYHAGVDVVEKPDVFHSRRELDFGPGFYLTDIYDQAVNWAHKKAKKHKKRPLINKYILRKRDLLNLDNVRSLIFDEYDERWLDFVVGNRLGQDLWKDCDYVEGGVADDRVVDTIDLYITGFSSKADTIERLKYLKPNNQICILRQNLLDNFLQFKECVTVS